MKQIRIVVFSLASLLFGRASGYCTVNAGIDPAVQSQLDAQAAEIAALKAQLAEKPAPENNSPLALLAKGAEVDLDDVRWRVQAGLDPEQAVLAALAQKAENARVAAAAEEAAKAAKKKGGN